MHQLKFSAWLLAAIFISTANQLNAQKRNAGIYLGIQANLPERFFNNSLSDYNNKNGGIGFHLMPFWEVTKNYTMGINIEYALVTENYQTDNIGTFDIISFMPTFYYRLTDTKLQPFAGIGIGMYHVLYHTPAISFGVKPIIGISIYRVVNVSLEYNQLLQNIAVDPKKMGAFDNYYLGIKGSFRIGILSL